jgi:hypothetical protein
MNRLIILLKAIRELGIQQVGLNALYRLGLASGHYRRLTSPGRLQRGLPTSVTELCPLFTLPAQEEVRAVIGEQGRRKLQQEADEILAGKVRLFGAEPVALQLSLTGDLGHWTEYERGKRKPPEACHPDIKFTWEPARFGWAFVLGRAYHLGWDEKYAAAFWRYFETFDRGNPPGMGPQWMSAQEVALRLMAFAWAGQVFAAAKSSTPERNRRLAESVAEHARRIPPTLVYARSQHNNHLLSEATGLLTAGLALPDLPESDRWRELGWKWLNRGLQTQIDGYGEYSQHSTNYHRLMLQVALWAHALRRQGELRWQFKTLEALKRAVHWMLALLDSETGRVPNLGANDGAYIFPLSTCLFEDQRPVLHAAARAFLEYDLPAGAWDEMALWLGVGTTGKGNITMPRYLGDQLYGKNSWAYLRTAQYNSHPSHADQLHLDLWWRGQNITPDAGSYLYNGEKPWDNALCSAFVHNTVTVNGRDQMTRAGRFLYLDWVNAYRASLKVKDTDELQRVRGLYRGKGYRHMRIVSVREGDVWRVEDEILPLIYNPWRRNPLKARLHWLLPDWDWEMDEKEGRLYLRIKSPRGWMEIDVQMESASIEGGIGVSLWRAGEALKGEAVVDPTRGWVSPTYGVKYPALSLAVETKSRSEIRFTTTFTFPQEGN